jgi:phage gpG-like protein
LLPLATTLGAQVATDGVQVDLRELIKHADASRRNLRTLSEVTPTLASILVSAIEDVFEAEGPGWAKLDPKTIKRRRSPAVKILQDTGVLATSIHPQHGVDFAEASAGATYGVYHVTGTKHMPKRDFTAIDWDETLEDITAIILEHLTQ